MSTADETRRRWAARVCQLNAWSRELRDRAKDCDAAFEQLDSPSCGAEVAFALEPGADRNHPLPPCRRQIWCRAFR
jgi:hypothetical protein